MHVSKTFGIIKYCPGPEASPKGEEKGAWEFLHGTVIKPTLNLNLVSHPVAMWAPW